MIQRGKLRGRGVYENLLVVLIPRLLYLMTIKAIKLLDVLRRIFSKLVEVLLLESPTTKGWGETSRVIHGFIAGVAFLHGNQILALVVRLSYKLLLLLLGEGRIYSAASDV